MVSTKISVPVVILSPFNLSFTSLPLSVEEVMKIVQTMLLESGGVVMAVEEEEEFLTAIEAGLGTAESGCFINGSGEI